MHATFFKPTTFVAYVKECELPPNTCLLQEDVHIHKCKLTLSENMQTRAPNNDRPVRGARIEEDYVKWSGEGERMSRIIASDAVGDLVMCPQFSLVHSLCKAESMYME